MLLTTLKTLADDFSFSADKQLHFFFSVGIVVFITMFFLILIFPLIVLALVKMNFTYKRAKDYQVIPSIQILMLIFAAVVCLALGFGKEFYDLVDYGLFSFPDLVWDVIGCIVGLLISTLLYVIADVAYFVLRYYIKKRRKELQKEDENDAPYEKVEEAKEEEANLENEMITV